MEDVLQDPVAAQAAAEVAAQEAALQAYINDQVNERVATLGTHLIAQLQARPSGSAKPSKPNSYDGHADPELWLYSLRLYYAAADITSDVHKIAFADALLRGDALIWRRSLDYVVEAWDEWKALLVTAFQPVNPVEGARDRLAGLRQTGSVRAYASIFRSVTLQIPKITDDEKKDPFIRGLKSKIFNEMKIKDPRNFEEAVWLAVKLDSYGTSWRPKMEPDPRPMRQPLTDRERTEYCEKGLCFKCRQKGHVARDCPENSRRL